MSAKIHGSREFSLAALVIIQRACSNFLPQLPDERPIGPLGSAPFVGACLPSTMV